MNEQEFNNELKQFTGSEVLYKYILGLKITLGVKKACELSSCWWFADILGSYQYKLIGEEFQVWKLRKIGESKAIVICEDGNKNELIRQHIPYTDFPFSELNFWCIKNIILLPNEY